MSMQHTLKKYKLTGVFPVDLYFFSRKRGSDFSRGGVIAEGSPYSPKANNVPMNAKTYDKTKQKNP